MDDDPDSELVARVGRGDALAVRRLVTTKLPRLAALANRLLGDPSEAEDVAQETFVRVWRAASRWQPGRARLDTWLHTIALNLCRDRMRRRRETAMAEPPEQSDPTPLADHCMEADERAAAISAAVAALPERQREAIVLQYYQGLTNIAAAEVMGVSVEAIEALLARGRRTLRAKLERVAHDG